MKSTDFCQSMLMDGSSFIPAKSILERVCTALTQIAAEELEVPLDRVNLIRRRHRADARPGSSTGAASRSRYGGMQIRKAARQRERRSLRWPLSTSACRRPELRIENGTIKGSDKRFHMPMLVGGRTFSLKVGKDAPA